MSSVGMDRLTGRRLTGFDHVLQSLSDILTTMIGERVLREWYGFAGLSLLGEPMNHPILVRFFQLMSIALSLRQLNGLSVEPRFRIVRITPVRAERHGEFSCRIEGEYMPRGHLGDPTVEGRRRVVLTGAGGRFTAIEESKGGLV